MNKWVEVTAPGTCFYKTQWLVDSCLLEEMLAQKPNCTVGYVKKTSVCRKTFIQPFIRGTGKKDGSEACHIAFLKIVVFFVTNVLFRLTLDSESTANIYPKCKTKTEDSPKEEKRKSHCASKSHSLRREHRLSCCCNFFSVKYSMLLKVIF